MDSDFQQQQYQHHFQDPQKQFHHQKQQLNTLTRFRSAPSSYFASFLDAADTITASTASTTSYGGDLATTKRDFSNARPLSPETENIFARFMSSMGDGKDGNNSTSQKLSEIPENSQIQPEFMVRVKQETDTLPQTQQHHQHQQGSYNTSSPMMYLLGFCLL